MYRRVLEDIHLRTLIDIVPVSIFIKDAKSNFVYINKACEQAWQLSSEDLIGRDGGHVFPPQQQQYFLEADKKVFADGVKVEFEEWVGGENLQQNRLYFTIKMPIYDASGLPLYLIGITQDITEKKHAEMRIKRLSSLYKALSEVNQAIVRMSDASQLFPLVCRCAVEFGEMQMAWIGQLDSATNLIKQVESYGHHTDYLDGLVLSLSAEVPEGLGPAGTALREDKVVIVNDMNSHLFLQHWRDKTSQYGWQSMGAFPISRAGKPVAVLCAYDNQKDAFDSEVTALFSEMVKDVSFALDNFDRETQRQADEASKRIAALVYETSSEAMMLTDANYIVIGVNNAFTEITQYTKEEVLGQSATILRSGKHDTEFYRSVGQVMQATGKWQGEIWNKRKDGELFPSQLTLNTIYNEDGSFQYSVSLFVDISLKKYNEEVIWHQGNVDALTGLPNRRMFHQHLEQEIKKSQRSGLPLVLMFLDLDNFKEVNDTLGHAVGDLLLKQASVRLMSCVREFDSLARLGGDEFTVILSEVDDLKAADRVIAAILESIAEPFQLNDKEVFVSVSIGVTIYPNDAIDADTLLKNADQAMYAAKNAGRNQFVYFTHSMQEMVLKRVRMAADLRIALQAEQIWVAYQPILDLKTGRIVKAEALARWSHPSGLISPAEFIPIAEHTGLIIDIGQWIFQQAMVQVKRWQEMYLPDFQIGVNKSPVQIQYKLRRFSPWGQQLAEAGLSGKSIVVEITEGLLLDANTFVGSKLLEFRDAGIQVALDDFGTGYSSLSYLKKLDIDYIKIDQSFVANLAENSDDLALCEAIILMAHKLGAKVVAEGIETEQQRQLLLAAGCDYGQGYLFAKPLPADEFECLLMQSLRD